MRIDDYNNKFSYATTTGLRVSLQSVNEFYLKKERPIGIVTYDLLVATISKIDRDKVNRKYELNFWNSNELYLTKRIPVSTYPHKILKRAQEMIDEHLSIYDSIHDIPFLRRVP